MMDVDVTLKGVQKAQDENVRRIAALRPSGAAGRMVRDTTAELHRYTVAITHVWKYKGGGLKASHRMQVRGLEGRIYIDPTAVNPRGQRPVDYGPHEHARGGSHAFYARTIAERGPQVAEAGVRFMVRSMELS